MSQTTQLRIQTILLLSGFVFAKQGWEKIQPAALCQEQTIALQGLLKRNIPQEFWFYFDLSVSEDCQVYSPSHYGSVHISSKRLTNGTNQILIIGNSGISVAFGLNHYLKYSANSQITWTERRVVLEHPLPEVDQKIISLDKFR